MEEAQSVPLRFTPDLSRVTKLYSLAYLPQRTSFFPILTSSSCLSAKNSAKLSNVRESNNSPDAKAIPIAATKMNI